MKSDIRCPKCNAEIHAPDGSGGPAGACMVCGMRVQAPGGVIEFQEAELPERMNPNLTDCADCGQQISKRADACPHCGAPTGQIVNAIQGLLPKRPLPPPPLPRPIPRIDQSGTDPSLWLGVISGRSAGVILMAIASFMLIGCFAALNYAERGALFAPRGTPDAFRGIGIVLALLGVTSGGFGLHLILKDMKSRRD